MIEQIYFKGTFYPKFQSTGFAAQFAIPFAQQVCQGIGFDIGFSKEEWQYPGSIGVDSSFYDGEWHAMNLPNYYFERDGKKIPTKILKDYPSTPSNIISIDQVDYVFSSHCLEHLDNWVKSLDYWISKLKIGGTLFLYLPHHSQKYWSPFSNKKHIHSFGRNIIREYLEAKSDMDKIYVSGVDLNNSFMVMAEKK